MGDVNRTFIFDTVSSGSTDCCNIINFNIDSTIQNITYLGYGEPNTCKILKVETISGSTYDSFWSGGNEDLNKVWDNRDTYSYF